MTDLLEEIYRGWGRLYGYSRAYTNEPGEIRFMVQHWHWIGRGYIANWQFEKRFKEFILNI